MYKTLSLTTILALSLGIITPLCAEKAHDIEVKVESVPLSSTSSEKAAQTPTQSKSGGGSREADSDNMGAWMIEAAKNAKDYVETLDKGDYAKSWSMGDPLFQRTISQNEWASALDLSRKRLGKMKSRTLKDQRPAWDPQGLPKGPYMVVEYNTSFEKAPQSGELLTLRRDSNGNWRVLTYQVN